MADTNTAVLDNGAEALVTPNEGIKRYDDFVISGDDVDETAKAAKQPEPEEPKVEDDPAGSETTENQAEDEAKDEPVKPKRPGGLTRKLMKAESKNAELEARIAQLEQPAQTAPQQPNGAPRLDQFQDYETYMRALIRWENHQETQEREVQTKVENYRKQQDAARQRYADYDDVINDYEGPINPSLSQAVIESDVGGDLSYYLGNNPDIIDRLNTMTPLQVGREIARIELQLEEKLNPPKKAEISPAKVTKAPVPVAPVGSTKTASTVSPDDMDYEQYKVWRARQR